MSPWVKAHWGGGGVCKIVVTLYYFLRVPCLNFNHVIIMKDFHNVFAYYGRSKLNKSNSKEITFFDLI